MNIGENIKIIRTSKGLTQKELAKKLGKTSQYVSKIEKNTSRPNISTLNAIANALDVPTSILLRPDNMLDSYARLYFETARIAEGKKLDLMYYFNKLNDLGQTKALERVKEMVEIDKYTDPNYTDPDKQQKDVPKKHVHI